MSTPTFVRRSVALLASAGAAAALTLIPATGAQAAVKGLYVAEGSSNASYTGSGGGTCDLSSGSEDAQSSVRHFSHGTKHASVKLKATYTNSLDSSDMVTVNGHLDTSLTLKRKHNDLTSFDYTAGGSIAIDHTTLGSSCTATAELLGAAQVTFTEHHKGWFYLTRDTKKQNCLVELVLINTKNSKAITLDVFEGTNSHVTSRALLKPGTYEIAEFEAGITAGATGIFKSGERSEKVAKTIHISGQFKPKKKH